jgi:hypothetical protein
VRRTLTTAAVGKNLRRGPIADHGGDMAIETEGGTHVRDYSSDLKKPIRATTLDNILNGDSDSPRHEVASTASPRITALPIVRRTP